MRKNILVTGSAGFIGFHLCKKLIETNNNVIGIDNLNDYYDIYLKEKRLEILSQVSIKENNWKFIKIDIEKKESILNIFEKYQPEVVVHLAAQAGVRYSLDNPSAYISSNIFGFLNILEACKTSEVKSLLYASSSSVYGGNTKVPFSENDSVNHPVSIYAATKRSNELMAHSYSHLYSIPCTGLRFFTVYGPWGRPDMAPMIFAKAIINEKPIKIFNYGNMSRSFTFIDDVIEVIMRLIHKPAIPDKSFNTDEPIPSTSWSPHMILNIGNPKSIRLLDFINHLENEIGKKSIREFQAIQKGDVIDTLSDNRILEKLIGNFPETSLKKGIKIFINWYWDYHKKLY